MTGREHPDVAGRDPRDEVDILIGRLVDGEAADEDRAVFASRAAVEPSLWQVFADRQRDAVLLESVVSERLDDMQRVELPGTAGRRGVAWWAVAVTGWAALIALALVWRNAQPAPRMAPENVIGAEDDAGLDREGLLEAYLDVPFADEIAPMVLQVEPLEDGRWRIRYLRRIEEVGIFTGAEPPEGDGHHLTVHPASLDHPDTQRDPD